MFKKIVMLLFAVLSVSLMSCVKEVKLDAQNNCSDFKYDILNSTDSGKTKNYIGNGETIEVGKNENIYCVIYFGDELKESGMKNEVPEVLVNDDLLKGYDVQKTEYLKGYRKYTGYIFELPIENIIDELETKHKKTLAFKVDYGDNSETKRKELNFNLKYLDYNDEKYNITEGIDEIVNDIVIVDAVFSDGRHLDYSYNDDTVTFKKSLLKNKNGDDHQKLKLYFSFKVLLYQSMSGPYKLDRDNSNMYSEYKYIDVKFDSESYYGRHTVYFIDIEDFESDKNVTLKFGSVTRNLEVKFK